LKSIIEDLQVVFEFKGHGCIPVHAQGLRWLNHKRKALQWVVDQFGAYLSHLVALSKGSSLKYEDRACLRGYLLKWSHAKFLFGSAMFIEVVKGPALLSLCLQKSDCDIVKQLLKTINSLKSLREKDPLEWSTVNLFEKRLSQKEVL